MRMEQLAQKFGHKAMLRESYLEDILQLIQQQDLGGLQRLEEAETVAHKLEALGTDVLAHEPLFRTLSEMAVVIEKENYHSKAQVIRRRKALEGQPDFFEFFHDCEEVEAWIYEIWVLLQAASLGRDLSQIQQAIQNHKYFANITEANSWFDDRKPLLINEDYGKDEASTTALLHRHQRLEKEMEAYASEVK
ncbi:hypothetical protein cypCar_00006743 [Cyprinus carpio]|nr:hypothetical protein cypCar_00006743 [Cyprinus carpio]